MTFFRTLFILLLSLVPVVGNSEPSQAPNPPPVSIPDLDSIATMAKEGDPVSQNYLGFLYATGKFVQKNEKLAFFWFQKAADQGYHEAINNLAMMYERGIGTPKDPQKAAALRNKLTGASSSKQQDPSPQKQPPARRVATQKSQSLPELKTKDTERSPILAQKEDSSQKTAPKTTHPSPKKPGEAAPPATIKKEASSAPPVKKLPNQSTAPAPQPPSSPKTADTRDSKAAAKAKTQPAALPSARSNPMITQQKPLPKKEGLMAQYKALVADLTSGTPSASTGRQKKTAIPAPPQKDLYPPQVISKKTVTAPPAPNLPPPAELYWVQLDENVSFNDSVSILRFLFGKEPAQSLVRIRIESRNEGKYRVSLGPFSNAWEAKLHLNKMNQLEQQLWVKPSLIKFKKEQTTQGKIKEQPFIAINGQKNPDDLIIAITLSRALLNQITPGATRIIEVSHTKTGEHQAQIGPFKNTEEARSNIERITRQMKVSLSLLMKEQLTLQKEI